jgi:hypothetical protein
LADESTGHRAIGAKATTSTVLANTGSHDRCYSNPSSMPFSLNPSFRCCGGEEGSHGLAGKATSSAIGSGHACFKGIHQKSVLTCFDVIEDILKNIISAYTF